MDGISQIIQDSEDDYFKNATEEDFLTVINSFRERKNNDTIFVFVTGIGGYLQYGLSKFGKNKLPRKMKKKIYLTKKLRKIHIPKYYVNS